MSCPTTQTGAEVVARIRAEGAITMAEATKLFGVQSNGKYRTPATIAQYCRRGKRGVRLDGYYGPSGWITSAAAVERFLAELHEVEERELERLVAPGAVAMKEESRRKQESLGREMTRGERAAAQLERLAKSTKRREG